MRIGRLVLVVATLVAILVFPLVLKDAVQALKLPSAYAAQSMADAGGRLYQNGNNNGNNNDNDGGNNDGGDDDNDNNNDGSGDGDDNESSDNEGESGDNDNAVCYESLNSNEEVPCDFDDNGNDNYYAPAPAPAPAAPSASAPQANNRCFAAGETGNVALNLSGGAVVVRVVGPGLPQSSWIELANVNDLGSVPAPPAGATLLDTMVWRINSGAGCSSGAAGQVSGDVNLGIAYSVPANKSRLQIVMLQNGQWVEVPTVADPDPNNPYISATIRNTGAYAVIQKP